MKEQFTFSFYIKQPVPYLSTPRWWEVWKKPSLAYRDEWQRKVFTGLTKEEADLLIAATCAPHTPLMSLILRFGGSMSHLQLENGLNSPPIINL